MQEGRKARKQRKSELNKNDDQEEDASTVAMDKVKEMKANRKKKSKQASLFDENNIQSKNGVLRQRRHDDKRKDEEKAYSIMGTFQKLDELDEQIGSNMKQADRALLRDYMRNAQDAWEDFTTISAFYPASKTMKYTGFYALRRGRRTLTHHHNVNLEAHNMATRLRKVKIKNEDGSTTITEEPWPEMDDEERQIHQDEEEKNRQLVQATQFRGISFDKWLRVFIRYAYILAITRRVEDAYELLKKASDANVFYQDVAKKTAIRFAMVGCGVIGTHETIIQLGARWLCNFYQFQNDPYRLYIAVIHQGSKESHIYASSPQLRYLMRNIRLMDALVANRRKEIDGLDGNATTLEEIKELNDAILSMNVDPSTANEQNYSRFYDIPADTTVNTNKHNIDKMGISSPSHVSPMLLTLFGHLMSLSKSPLAASCKYINSFRSIYVCF